MLPKLRIQYPTSKLVESYLSKFFGSPIALGPCISTMGHIIGGGNMCLLQNANVPGASITGIDIPVLVSDPTRNSDKTIMIIEQDPLRNQKEFQKYGPDLLTHAIVGTPNALHSNRPVKFYENLVRQLVSKGWKVYLTDTFKIYAPNLKNKKGRFTGDEKNLLEDEIQCVKPSMILLLGKKAQIAYNSLQGSINHVQIEKFLHPSGYNNPRWLKQYQLFSVTDNEKIQYILSLIP